MAKHFPEDRSDIPVVILCGGEGTRMREVTDRMPKPLVDVGGKPILLHIMEIYSRQGFTNFILCLGYKGIMIKEAFLDYEVRSSDMVLDFRQGERHFVGTENPAHKDWRITFAETGESTQTGGRIARIAPYITGERFMLTYGDGLSDVDLHSAMDFHESHGRIGTVTGVQPSSQFGVMAVDGDQVKSFAEKPRSPEMVNGGFFIFERKFLDYVSPDPGCILERQPLENLSADGELKVYAHDGYWRCMDTFKDYRELNDGYAAGITPWLPDLAHQSVAS
ncbi:glucose-1-phosphate cytidylyltransferase [Rhodobacteraceae bacterium KMM 6894]|nr:glucose-1-phosphate cytidylyltransferase [Rhodobacteraceae bacterium KMM 6894]